MKKHMKQHYLRIYQLSEITSIDYQTIYNWVKEGILKSVKIGNVIIIPISDIRRLGIEVPESVLNGEPKEVVQ
jgi:predicted site-specific integrase-resolvase